MASFITARSRTSFKASAMHMLCYSSHFVNSHCREVVYILGIANIIFSYCIHNLAHRALVAKVQFDAPR